MWVILRMLPAMLRIDGLGKSYGVRTLFASTTYHFPVGERIALVGANGAGKTTLLNILSGQDAPDSGSVTAPADTRVGYLPQKPNPQPASTVLLEAEAGAKYVAALKAEMERTIAAATSGDETQLARYDKAEAAFRLADGYALESKATSILRGLGFSPEDLKKHPGELSGGWRMRLELARLFLNEPDFLILDEPTNHLDLPSLVWVESYLTAYRGTLLFVSHDRALLNRLATITLHLSSGKLTPYRGNFDKFLETREERMMQNQAQAEQLRRKREDMQKFVDRFGAKATKAAQAQSRVKMIARIREVEDTIDTNDDSQDVFIDIPPPPKTPRIVYTVENGAIGYDKDLARGVKLTIERGAKIAIIGANGIGKSTLLRTIAGRLPARGGSFSPTPGVKMAYFAQDQQETLDLHDTVLANVLKQTTLAERAARSLLGGFLFRGDDVFKKATVLSGGELSRLGLACTLAREAGLLLLDEPTNHLDMASVETLAAGVDAYEGTVAFVSHDRTFIDAVATHVFAMLPDGRSMLFEGKLADYARLAQIAGFPNVLEAVETDTRDLRKSSSGVPNQSAKSTPTTVGNAPRVSEEEIRELKRQRQRLETQVGKLDKEMQAARDRIAAIEQEMATTSAMNFSQLNKLQAEIDQRRNALDASETTWLGASEELEGVTAKLTALGRQ